MNPEERDDDVLREYLEGDSALSRLYKRGAGEQPDPRMDARIRAEARRAVAPDRRVAHSPFARNWMVPTSLAAVFVLSLSVVVLIPESADDAGVEVGEPARTAPAAISTPAPDSVADVEDQPAAASPPAVKRAAESDAKSRQERKAVAAEREAVSGADVQSLPAPAAALGSARNAAPDASPLPAPGVRDDPRAWLRFIEELLGDENRDGATSNLRAFLDRYPDFPLPASLLPLAASLDAQ
jgi:hypothetical protein